MNGEFGKVNDYALGAKTTDDRMKRPPRSEVRAKRGIRFMTVGSDLSAKRRWSFQGTNIRTAVVRRKVHPIMVKTVGNFI